MAVLCGMKYFELSYEFPLGSGQRVRRNVEAETVEQALDRAGVINPTLTATEIPAPLPTTRGGKRPPRRTAIAGQYKDFVDFAREHGTIRVQLPQHAVPKFNSDYESITGATIDADTEHYSIIGGVYKWGATLTLMFPKEGAVLAPPHLHTHKYVHADEDLWCIMDNAFIFELFSIGFRLGKNHDKTVEIGLALSK
jgi:hypothetical protein